MAGSGSSASGHYRPVQNAKLTDTFGAPRSGGRKHQGIDIFAHEGTPIHAVASGKIVTGFSNSLGGNVVRIQGDDGRYYYYAHLKTGSTNDLHVGQHVSAGDVIGEVGHTGDAATTPSHLHFQVRENGTWVDPYNFLTKLPEWSGETAHTATTTTAVAAAATTTTTAAATDPFEMSTGAKPSSVDSDHDGLTDEFEKLLGTNAHQVDTDHDGLSDSYETTVSHTNPLSADTDADHIADGVEVGRGGDPGHASISAAARAAGFGGLSTLDSDHDGLSDAYEKTISSDPFSADTDHDSVVDSVEVARGTSPLLLDSNNDGVTDAYIPGSGSGTGADALDTGSH